MSEKTINAPPHHRGAATRRPWIAVLLDENTSVDRRRYESSKGFFEAVRAAGGLPFGIPYADEMAEVIARDFDGVLLTGGRYASPPAWYRGHPPSAPEAADRVALETRIASDCLRLGRPILGVCAGMQVIAGVSGCRLSSVTGQPSPAIDHAAGAAGHRVRLSPGSHLLDLIGQPEIHVNSFHHEAIEQLAPSVRQAATSADGVTEAIEVRDHPFAIGIQWHQELLAGAEHPGDAVFQGLVDAATRQAARKGLAIE